MGLLDETDLAQATAQYYGRIGRYAADEYNSSGLAPWENLAVERHFPPGGRVLVLGAGGGREVVALEQRGFAVSGFECTPTLVESGNGLLQRLGLSARLAFVPANEAPVVRGFDAALVGWGAYMHIPGRERRIRFLRGIRAALAPGGPLLLSFFARKVTGRSDRWAARLANALRTLRGRGNDRIEMGDRLQGSFDHYFTEDEIREELEASGFRLAHYSEAEYPHALGFADERPAPTSPSDESRA